MQVAYLNEAVFFAANEVIFESPNNTWGKNYGVKCTFNKFSSLQLSSKETELLISNLTVYNYVLK